MTAHDLATLEHLRHESFAAQGGVVQTAADRHAAGERHLHAIRTRRRRLPRRVDVVAFRMAAPCRATRPPTRSIRTTARRSSSSPTSTRAPPGASGQIAGRIAQVIFAQADSASVAAREQAAPHLRRPREGADRPEPVYRRRKRVLHASRWSVTTRRASARSARPREFASGGESLRGGMTIRSYRIRAGSVVMDLTTMTLPNGKIDQYLIARAG